MTTIRVAQQVQLLYARGWGPGCLANTDLVNPVFFGHDRALGPSSDQIPGLGAIPVDGSRDIYGSTLASGVTVAVQSMPGVTNWAPSPAQVSAQINALGLARDTTVGTVATNTGNVHTDLALGTNAFLGGTSAGALVATPGNTVAKEVGQTGVPLLGMKNVLGSNAAGLAIGASQQATPVSSAAITQVGYEMLFKIWTAAGTASPVIISVQWADSVTGLITDTQTWGVFAGTTAAPHFVRITGPFNGDRVTVLIINGANAITLAYAIMQSSRVYTRHFGHTVDVNFTLPVFPGFTFASCDPSTGVLCAQSQSVGAGGNNAFLLPLYSGTARFWGRASDTTGTNSEWRLTYNAGLTAFSDNIPYQIEGGQGFSPAGPGSAEIDSVALPRTQMNLQMLNHNGAAANTMEAHLIAQEMAA